MDKKVKVDHAESFLIREFYDGSWHDVAEVRLKAGYTPWLVIHQRGHSSVDSDGNFTTSISGEVLAALGESVRDHPR